jgi:hypothetical protein
VIVLWAADEDTIAGSFLSRLAGPLTFFSPTFSAFFFFHSTHYPFHLTTYYTFFILWHLCIDEALSFWYMRPLSY